MIKKILLLIFIALWFSFSFLSMASEASGNYKWFKFDVTVPTDFVFDLAVVIELTEENTGETFLVYAKKENEYLAYQNVLNGKYIISNISVPGNYEGYFSFGYPEEAFLINNDSADMTEIPILIELHYYGEDAKTENADNMYEGMSYDEVMAAIEKDTSTTDMSELSDTEPNLESENISSLESALETEADDNFYDTETQEEQTLEEKMNEIKAVYKAEEKTKQMKEANKHSLQGGLIAMCFALVGLGIGFYVLKKKRDV